MPVPTYVSAFIGGLVTGSVILGVLAVAIELVNRWRGTRPPAG